MNSTNSNRIRSMAVTALWTAILCILCPLAIPIGPVPVTLAVFIIFLGIYILGPKRAIIAVCLYLLLGCAGLPVFSGFTGGIGKLLGPTGGYLIGYVPMSIVAGALVKKSTAARRIHGSARDALAADSNAADANLASLAKHRRSRCPASETMDPAGSRRFPLQLLAFFLGLAVLYVFGTAWFVQYMNSPLLSGAEAGGMTWAKALAVCVWPFIVPDIIKAVLAVSLGNLLRGRLSKAGLG